MKIIHPIFVWALLASGAVPATAADTRPAKPAPKPAAAATTSTPSAPPAPPAPRAPEPVEHAAASARPLDAAQALYDRADFAAARDALTKGLANGQFTGDDVILARALRARCLVKLGRRLEAKEAFKGVLRTDRAFKLDPAQVPPDEMDSFRLAAQEFDSELAEAGKRFPASIAFSAGTGSAVNQDLVDLASSAGVEPADDFEGAVELGWSVRFPLRPTWSLDLGITRLKATTEDKLPAARNAHAEYTASAMPFVVSIVHNLSTSPRRRVNAFAGVGPMLAQAIIENQQTLVSGRLIPVQIVGHNQGWYLHAGLEGEYMVRPRLALTAQAALRRANSGKLHLAREDFELYESYPVSKLGERTIDFSGYTAQIGLRAYIGY